MTTTLPPTGMYRVQRFTSYGVPGEAEDFADPEAAKASADELAPGCYATIVFNASGSTVHIGGKGPVDHRRPLAVTAAAGLQLTGEQLRARETRKRKPKRGKVRR